MSKLVDVLFHFASAVSVVSLLLTLSNRGLFSAHVTSEPRCSECSRSVQDLKTLSWLMLGGLGLAALYRLQTTWMECIILFTWVGLSVFAAIQSIWAISQLLESKES